MTPRERFRQTMRLGQPDRPPLLEEGMRDDVLGAWRQQGLAADADLHDIFHYDRRERIEPNLLSRSPLRSFPPSPAELESFARGLDPDDASRLPPDWSQRVAGWRDRTHLIDLYLHRGLFLTLGVDAYATLEPVMYFLADHPDLAREAMEIQGTFAARLAQRLLDQVQVDFVSFSEPIADNHGPMISPEMYRKVVLPSYRPILDVLHRAGVRTVVYMIYGQATPLLGDVLDAGFDCLWAMEVENQAMDYRRLRREYGASLRLIGGIDLDALTRGPAAIDREIQEKVPPLLAQGGYVPLADGRVRATVPYGNYAHYRRRLEETVG